LIAYGGSEISDEQVAEVLDLIDRRQLLAIAEACVDGDPARALESCTEAGAGGADAKRLAESLLQLLRDLVVLSLAPDREGLVEASEDEVAELRALAERTDTTRLRRMFRALVKEQEDLAWAPQPFAVLEMAVVRLASLPAGDDVARLIGRLDALERRLADGAGPGGDGGAGGGGARGAGAATGAGSPTRRAASAARPRGGSKRADPAGAAAPVAVPSADAPGAAPSTSAPAAGRSLTGAPLPVVFDRLRAFVKDENAGIYAALEGSQLVAADEQGLRIAVPQAFAARRLQDKAELLETLSERFFGHPTPVRIEVGSADASPGRTPAPDPEHARRRRAAALKDPGVGRALEILGGEIVDILPLGERG
jgi:DNA polymerase-3 subunit gamma/tau